MKSTGIVRKLDDLGRVVIPKELRTLFGLANRESVEIFTDADSIVLKRYEHSCSLCNSRKRLQTIPASGKLICGDCAADVRLLPLHKSGEF